jgi:hypothetical protein
MNRNALFVAPLAILYIAVPVRGQEPVNPSEWMQRDGLTVASVQKVTTRPTKLRLFTTITARDQDVRRAISSLAEEKKSARDKLQSLSVKPNAVSIAPSRILEWKTETDDWWWGWDNSTYPMHIPNKQPSGYTAYSAVQVDWEFNEQTNDELILMPIDLIGRIREADVFNAAPTDQTQRDPEDVACEIYMLFVGEISEEAGDDATKRAYDEANAQALKLAATTNRPLGKLVAMAPRVDSYSFWDWDGRYSTVYAFRSRKNSVIPHPMSAFSHLRSEVFSGDPADLHRTFSVELRFELK